MYNVNNRYSIIQGNVMFSGWMYNVKQYEAINASSALIRHKYLKKIGYGWKVHLLMVTVQVQGEIEYNPFTTARRKSCSWPTDAPGCSPECWHVSKTFSDVMHSGRIQLPKSIVALRLLQLWQTKQKINLKISAACWNIFLVVFMWMNLSKKKITS